MQLKVFSLKKASLRYIQKYAYPYQLVDNNPNKDLSLIVVIPAIDEAQLLKTLDSLKKAELPKGMIEVIIVINSADNSPKELIQRNRAYYLKALLFAQENSSPELFFLPVWVENLPKKHAGAGWARKIGMDEAVRRFSKIEKNGIIINLDADSWVDENYFKAIELFFHRNPKKVAANLYFEHPLQGAEYSDSIYRLIYQYELHLRYNVQMLKYIQFPYAFHTLGSAFALPVDSYIRVNGMNRRQAGEDFYFLHKLTQLGDLGEITNTCVHPSPRPSFRVPFGTGALIRQSLENEANEVLTYPAEIYLQLRTFFGQIENIYSKNLKLNDLNIASCLKEFLLKYDFEKNCNEIRKNTAGFPSFKKRFYQWFNGFMVVKFQNFALKDFPKIPIFEAAPFLAKQKEADLLAYYRSLDKIV